MTEKALCFWVRCAIIAVALFGLAVCAVWIPISVINMPSAARWIQRVFYWLTSVPCFGVLVLGWLVTMQMKKGELFREKTAKLIQWATVILFVDIIVFFVGTLIFFLLKWNELIFLYSLVAVVGMFVVLFLAVVSHYISKAAVLQEESEGTI